MTAIVRRVAAGGGRRRLAGGGRCCRLGSRARRAGFEGFEGGDDLIEAVLDASEVGSEAELAVGVGPGDERAVGGGVLAGRVEELRGGPPWRGSRSRSAAARGPGRPAPRSRPATPARTCPWPAPVRPAPARSARRSACAVPAEGPPA